MCESGRGIRYFPLDRCVADAGVVEVERRPVEVPLGEWGGRAGSLMASDFRTTFTSLCSTFESRFGLPAALCQELLRAMHAECEGFKSRYTFTMAVGQRM